MTSLLYPRATQRHMPFTTGHELIASRGLILHVQQGNNSPFGWFANPAHQAVSHWWVSKTGEVEQYLDASMESWAQMAGNTEYHSVETEGFATEPLTTPQISALADLYEWGHTTFGWPLTLAETPGDSGFGWHGSGGAAWGGHYGCPGDLRKDQRGNVLALLTPGDDMPTTEDLLNALDAAATSTLAGTPVPGTKFIDGLAKRTAQMLAAQAANAAKTASTTPGANQ